jgi:hypothetical protein
MGTVPRPGIGCRGMDRMVIVGALRLWDGWVGRGPCWGPLGCQAGGARLALGHRACEMGLEGAVGIEASRQWRGCPL